MGHGNKMHTFNYIDVIEAPKEKEPWIITSPRFPGQVHIGVGYPHSACDAFDSGSI